MVQGNVGVGTTAAASAVTVSGGQTVGSGYVAINAPTNGLAVQGNVGIGTTAANQGTLIVSTGNVGIGTLTPVAGTAIMNGNVGIGTWSPVGALEVKGLSGATRIWTGAGTDTNATAAGELYVEGDLEVDGTLYGDGSGLTGTSGLTVAGGWTDGGPNVFLTLTSDNVGIGTTTPDTTLEIVKTSNRAPLMISSVPTASGDYMVMTSSGNVGLGTTTPVGAFTVMNGSVGIGTWSPVGLFQVDSAASGHQVTIGGGFVSLNGNDLTFNNNGMQRIYNNSSGASSALNVIGGGAAGSFLSLQSSAVAGTTDYIAMSVGNNGATEAMRIIHSGNVGIGTSAPVGGLTVMNGNVGIGTWSPTVQLQVVGNVGVTDEAYGNTWDGSFNVPTKNAVYDKIEAIIAGGASGWIDDGVDVHVTTLTDNVGIGTTGPSGTLEVVANSGRAPLMISATATGDGNFVLVSSSGNVGIGTVANASGLAVMNGNVGIGTWSPVQRLQVEGFVQTSQGIKFPDGSTQVTAAAGGGWSDGGTNVYPTTTTDLIGIGTTTGSTTLEIVRQPGLSPLMISSVATSDGDFLTMVSSGNIGIGTTVPRSALAVLSGNVGIGTTDAAAAFAVGPTSEFRVTSSGAISAVTGITTSGGYTQSGSANNILSGNVGLGTTPVGGLVVMTGNVGIGTWSPIGALEVKGLSATRIWTGAGTDTNATAAGELYVEGDLEVDGTIYGDGSGITALSPTLPAGGWTDGGTNMYQTTTTDLVGIGTTTPSTTFEIVKQGTNMPMMVSSTATADGDYLIINSVGNIGIGTVAPRGAMVVMNGNVGIGTTSPQGALAVGTASAFQVNNAGAITALTGITTTGGYSQTGTGLNSLSGNVGLGTTTPVGGLMVMNGPVGIGTWSPTTTGLEVRSLGPTKIWTGAGTNTNATSGGELYVEGDIEVDGTIYGDGTGITGPVQNGGGWFDGGPNVFLSTTTDNVGIGTTTPATTFEIVKTANRIPFMVSSTNTGAGDYLIVKSGGNVGIGTVLPSATLTVNGIMALEPSSTANITAGGGITVNHITMRVQGNGGPVTITANPQIASGVDGEILILQGMSNANTVQITNGNGVRLQGGVSFTMGLGDSITMSYDSSSGTWTEISRTDN
jgi:filamentous hemagglutinin